MQIEPGKYQMRNGECATVLAKNPVEGCYRDRYWIGVIGDGVPVTWCKDGLHRSDGRECQFDLRAPWPAPVVRDLIVVKVGNSYGMCAGGVNTGGGEHRFRLTWHPSQPDVLGWEVVK